MYNTFLLIWSSLPFGVPNLIISCSSPRRANELKMEVTVTKYEKYSYCSGGSIFLANMFDKNRVPEEAPIIRKGICLRILALPTRFPWCQ
ncbi:hypothetical protein D9M69_688140 [compost metagenome]